MLWEAARPHEPGHMQRLWVKLPPTAPADVAHQQRSPASKDASVCFWFLATESPSAAEFPAEAPDISYHGAKNNQAPGILPDVLSHRIHVHRTW